MKKLIIGITGSIAAFKTVQFISDLVKEKYEIEVMLTPSAAKFLTPTSISALTKKKTYIDVFDDDPGCGTGVTVGGSRKRNLFRNLRKCLNFLTEETAGRIILAEGPLRSGFL